MFGASVASWLNPKETLGPRETNPMESTTQDDQDTPHLSITFLGTTSFVLSAGGTTVLIDAFLSRPGKLALLSPLRPDRARIAKALSKAQVSAADAVFVSHTHYDHALDSATVTRHLGAKLYGSASMAFLAESEGGLPRDQVVVVRPPARYRFGWLEILVLKWQHSPGALFPGPISTPPTIPARASAYREGDCYAYLVRAGTAAVLIVPSAHSLPGTLDGLEADTVYLSIGQLGRQSHDFAENYWNETVLKVGAKTVVPVHWDDFTITLDEALRPFPRPIDQVDEALAWLTEFARRDGVKIVMPQAFMSFEHE